LQLTILRRLEFKAIHPSVTLDRWPSGDRDTWIVFITRNIPEVAIRKLFDAALAMRG
jgi:hypothetical protein